MESKISHIFILSLVHTFDFDMYIFAISHMRIYVEFEYGEFLYVDI